MFKDYNINQLILEVRLQNNYVAFHVYQLLESLTQETFEPFIQHEGCPAFHPRIMLKIILGAHTQSVF